tara:strand:- start:1530 stop:1721 length:192 start_codon:yes stop_codon:yes gene_type:complete
MTNPTLGRSHTKAQPHLMPPYLAFFSVGAALHGAANTIAKAQPNIMVCHVGALVAPQIGVVAK